MSRLGSVYHLLQLVVVVLPVVMEAAALAAMVMVAMVAAMEVVLMSEFLQSRLRVVMRSARQKQMV